LDIHLFGHELTGRIVPIDHPRAGHAFVPHSLSGDWEFDPALWPLLAEAKESLGTLNGIGQTIPDPLLLLRPLQKREAIASSSIEGTYVTPHQLLMFELDPSEPTSASNPVADWQEVFNYSTALQEGSQLLEELPLCNRLIKLMHKTLMHGVRGRNKSPGEFRKIQVQIGSSGRYIPPPANRVESLMNELEEFMNSSDTLYDPLVRSFLVHYQFEAIHPFQDGNGRVGRALLALMISHLLGHASPWLYLSAFFETYKDEYIQKIFNISTQGDWSSWVEFCLRGVIAQSNDSIRRCGQLNDLRTKFHERIETPSSRTHPLIESLFSAPLVTVPKVEKMFGIVYMTAKKDIELLMKYGILQELSNRKPRTFYCREVMKVAYEENE
jgi:Fic family protein